MSFKCAIQMTGLVREKNPSGKHRSNGRAILLEMAKERISKSETLDRSRTHLNRYDQENQLGATAWDDDMFARAENYKQEVKGKTKDGKDITRTKGLRHDAVLGVSIIINPPYEECKDWDDKKYQKFYEDTQEILEKLNPDIFRKSNQVFGVEHFDEGYDQTDRHKHIVYDAISKDGRYCGNKLDAKFLSDFNKIYPQLMRERGWKMADLETTDWQRYKTDEDYRVERKVKRKSQGRSVNKHIRDKAVKDLKKAESILKDAEEIQADIDQQLLIAGQRQYEIDQLDDDIKQLTDEYNNLSSSLKKRRTAAEKQLQDRLQAYKDDQLKNINDELTAYRAEQMAVAQADSEQILKTAARVKLENDDLNNKLKLRYEKLKLIWSYIDSHPTVKADIEKIWYGQQPLPRRSGKPNKKLQPRPQQPSTTPPSFMEYSLPSFDDDPSL